MQTMAEVRYPSILRARIPRELSDAVNATARARFLSKSEYVRQALLKSLQDDGALSLCHDRAVA
jgi:Arc/MetJ-type ribon-helix-helix transcriptional regulator